ncbi:hypothetical protein IE077_003114 [Cardiosporidium cionae]|uniref:Proteasome activator Blm10 middle HEAT repeats region domain-containing protein n=1 Tax=Cardiosporidium cionae TaxID=476202 RepID=A0ABQ7J919_9APIC|nr:hypothetical protein IE077_003114 [Cardiosporidium cionae]|eukprot:KAF8820506.1 hypothetical protein IE077_003114 [Cardiosporidium cionae]
MKITSLAPPLFAHTSWPASNALVNTLSFTQILSHVPLQVGRFIYFVAMALDASWDLANPLRYLPPFSLQHAATVAQTQLETLKELLRNPAEVLEKGETKSICKRIQLWVREYRFSRVESVEDLAFLANSLYALVRPQEKLALFSHSDDQASAMLSPTHLVREDIRFLQYKHIATALKELLRIIKRDSMAKEWMNPTCSSRFIKMEAFTALFKSDFQFFFNLFDKFYKKSYRDEISASVQQWKSFLQSTSNLLLTLRNFWNEEAIAVAVERFLEGNTKTDELSIYKNILYLNLFCTPSLCYRFVINGKLFSWWRCINQNTSSTWDKTFLLLLYKAVKYGWATGHPLLSFLQPHLPMLMQISLKEIGLPARVVVASHHKEIPEIFQIPGTKSIKLLEILAKIFVYLLEPINSSSSPEKHVAIEATTATSYPTILSFIEAFVNAVFPYTNPSNDGKWSSQIGIFFGTFVSFYSLRVCRERLGEAFTAPLCGRSYAVEGSILEGQNSITINGKTLLCQRLTKDCDVTLAKLLYPLIMQGLYSRNPSVVARFENSLRDLCFLLPDEMLEPTVLRLLESLEVVSESHQTHASLRLLGKLISYIARVSFI